MLTRRGWLTLAAGAALIGAGRLFGLYELYVLGAGAAGLAVAALAQVALARPRLVAAREVRPARVHAGSEARVELFVRNRAGRRSPVLALQDPFTRAGPHRDDPEGGRAARFLVPPIAPGGVSRAAYRLPTTRRGIYTVGPLTLTAADAFGLAGVAKTIATGERVIVYPRVDHVVPPPLAQGHEPYSSTHRPNAVAAAGDDFYALRPYQVGDDLRRVHWRATARYDDLMIRRDELPWQGRATVVLDVRRRVHTPESFEVAVSAVASVLTACWRRRSQVRLVATDGTDSGFATGAGELEAIMEFLAGVAPDRHDRLTGVLGRLRSASSGGALVAVTAGALASDLAAMAQAGRHYGTAAIVLVDLAPAVQPPTAVQPPPPVAGVVHVTRDRPFADAWNRAMAARTGRRGAARVPR